MKYFHENKLKLLDIKVSRLVDSNFLGNYKTAIKGHGIEFADIRKYNSGDSYKAIDWITSAKKGKLYIKKYEEERQLTIFFLIDVGGSMNFGINRSKIDTMLEVFYMLALSAMRNNDKIGAIIYDDKIRRFINPTKGKSNLLKILNAIEFFNQNPKVFQSDTQYIIDYINKIQIKNKLLIILTDDDEISRTNIFKIAGMKNEIIYINIYDNFENTLEGTSDQINLINQNNYLQIDLSNKKKKYDYKQLRKIHLDKFRAKLLENKIQYVYIDDKVNIFNELLRFFKMKSLKKI